MHADSIANYIEILASYSQSYPLIFLLLILFFMAVESSFIPFRTLPRPPLPKGGIKGGIYARICGVFICRDSFVLVSPRVI